MPLLNKYLILVVVTSQFYSSVSSCTGLKCGVPDFLSSTHIDVAAIANGATCAANGGTQCSLAFDASETTEWAANGGVNNYIKVTFAATFIINTLRVMQRGNIMEQTKTIRLDFSGGESTMLTLKRNLGKSHSSPSMWEVLPFPEVRTNWVKVTNVAVYSSSMNGFRELQFYNRNANKGKHCETIVLSAGVTSLPQPLFGQTVSLLLKTAGTNIILHEGIKSKSKKYTFVVAGGNCSLKRFDGNSETIKLTGSCTNVVSASGLRSVWIDLRCTTVMLGRGTDVLLQWTDSSPLEVSHISFEATSATEAILCHREDICYQDADHYWPLEKVSGGEVHDVNNGKNGQTHLTSSDFKPLVQIENMFLLSPLIDTTITGKEKYIIFDGLRGKPILDPEFGDFTFSLWIMIPASQSSSCILVYSRKQSGTRGFTIDYVSSMIRVKLHTRTKSHEATIAITKEKPYKLDAIWSKKKNLFRVLVNDVESAAQMSDGNNIGPSEPTVQIGRTDASKGKFYVSNFVVWMKELSAEQLHKMSHCTHIGNVYSSCSPAVKIVCGSSYTKAKCESVGCCFDGSQCFKRDGIGNKATLPAIARASSFESYDHTPSNGILAFQDAPIWMGWRPHPNIAESYLELDTQQLHTISDIAIQGSGKSSVIHYVKTFMFSHSKGCSVFNYIMDGSNKKVFNGNKDPTSIVTVTLPSSVDARCVRIIPSQFVGKVELKVKILGTKQAKNYLGCYKSVAFVPIMGYVASSLTPEKCIIQCGVAKKTHASMKNGRYCFCGDSVDSTNAVSDALCYLPCSGNPGLTCGSRTAYSVYKVTGTFRTSFSCSFPANVTSLNTHSATCSPNSRVICDIGESQTVKSENAPVKFSYYTVPENYIIVCRGYMDSDGDSCVNHFRTKIDVFDDFKGNFKCPSFAEKGKITYCALEISKGTGLRARYQFTNQSSISDVELCDAASFGVGVTFNAPVGGSVELTNGSTVLLTNSRQPGEGQFIGIEINVERAGCLSVQILRPICGSGPLNTYRFTNSKVEIQSQACSSMETKCTNGKMFGSDFGDCMASPQLVNGSVPQMKFETVFVKHICLTKVNRQKIYFESANISEFKEGDFFGLHFPRKSGIKISTRNSGWAGRSSSVVIYSTSNTGIGTIVTPSEGVSSMIEYSITLMAKLYCHVSIPIVYNNLGVYNEQITLSSKSQSQVLSAKTQVQERINVTWQHKPGAVVNEMFVVSVNVFKGSHMTTTLRFGNLTSYNLSWQFAGTQNFTHNFTNRQNEVISLTMFNGLSMVYKRCEIAVQQKVAGFKFIQSMSPVAYPQQTILCFRLTEGDRVTITADYGNNLSNTSGEFDIQDQFIGCFNHSHKVGVYNVLIRASNVVSEEIISTTVIVEKEIKGFKCIIEQEFYHEHIEVNETICVVCSKTQGTTPTYNISWGDGTFTISLHNKHCRSYSQYRIYNLEFSAENNVSRQNISRQIQVHKPVYPLSNFLVVCPPANHTNPTRCVLNIDGGNDFECTWNFGDGLTSKSNDSHVGHPFLHLYSNIGYYYLSINCSNRLYNTSLETLSIVETPMTNLHIGQIPNCAHGQTATTFVAVDTGSGINFTVTKENYHTKESVHLVPVFNSAVTNGTITFQCSAIGVYCLKATSENNVTKQQDFTMCFKIDFSIVGAAVIRFTDEYMTAGATSIIGIQMTQGSNVTCYYDFRDRTPPVILFVNDMFPPSGRNISHSIQIDVDASVNIICNNSVSQVTLVTSIKSQYPHIGLYLVCSDPQPFPPGKIQCTIDKPKEIPSPTNSSCTTDFGNGYHETKAFVPGVTFMINYQAIGGYNVNCRCINNIDNVSFYAKVEVQTPIDNGFTILTTSGGLYGVRGTGRGPDGSYFPTNSSITLEASWGNGTNVSLHVDWGDFSHVTLKNNTVSHSYRAAGIYTLIIVMKNAVNSKTKIYTLNIQDSVEGFDFTNNGPVALDKPFIFTFSVRQVGSRSCFSLDIDNGTSFLYKPENTVCEPECSYGSTVRYYTSKTLLLEISHVHKFLGNYKINAVACNRVSRIVVSNLANVSPKPCKYPKVNFTTTEANISRNYPVPYRKSIKFPITPTIKINCEATKLSIRTWELERCEGDVCKLFSPNCSKPMDMSTSTLVFPARCFPYGLYRLSVKVEMQGGGTIGIFVKASGYIEVVKTPLIARIVGGTAKAIGYGNNFIVDGTISLDLDTNNDIGIDYYWFCWEANESLVLFPNSTLWPGRPTQLHTNLRTALNQSNSSVDISHFFHGCFGHGPGRLATSSNRLSLSSDGMKVNHTYVVTLFITKDTRWATSSLSLSVISGNPPECSIECKAGCGKKINPSDKHALQVSCTCFKCGPIKYHWYLYKRNKTTNEMEKINNLQSIAITSIYFNNIVIRPDSLSGGSFYSFKITAYDTRNKVEGFSSRDVFTNPSPWNGDCDVIPRIGDTDTIFNITCPQWKDDDEYIIFYMNLYDPKTNIDTPIFKIRSDTRTWHDTKLPVGQEERDFNQTVRVKVCDPLLACKIVDTEVKVKFKEKDESEFQDYLKSLCHPDGKMNILLGEAKIDELCAFIFTEISNMKIQQATSPSWSVKTMELISKVVDCSMDATCKIISSDPKKASCKSSVISLLLSINTTISTETQNKGSECLFEAAKDVDSFSPSDLAAATPNMLSSIGASFKISASLTKTTTAPKTKEELERMREENLKRKEKSVNMCNSLGNAALKTMVPGEQTEISTPSGVSLAMSKQSPSSLRTLSSSSGVSLGGLDNTLQENSTDTVTTKMAVFQDNPFQSADGGEDVNSPLLEFNMGREDGSNKAVCGLEKPIELFIPAVGKINLTHHQLEPGDCSYHKITVPKNHSSIVIELLPCDENATFNLFLKRNIRPTRHSHDYNFTLDPNSTVFNVTDENNPNMWFLSNDELNHTAAGIWKLAVCWENNAALEKESDCSHYNISTFTAACMFYNTTTRKFSNNGLKVGNKTTREVTHCLATHLTSFASDFFVPPSSIDWSKISLDELLNNPIVFIVVMVIFGLYFLGLLWARRADKKDLDKVGLTPLPDNDPRDTYLYEIVVYTGHTSGAGTTSDVYMVLSGGLDEISPRQLCDTEPSRKKFGRGNVDYFLLAVPRSLGKLKHLRIWHNNKGDDPSWFLQRIMVRDLQVDKKTWFVNLRWLAVEEDDGMIERTLHPATKEELTNFGLLFSTEARKNLTDNHLWFSVLAKNAKSTFTRVQRLSCCLSIILTTMVANAMFYQVGGESSSGTSIHVGPFSFSIRQVSIGITSSLVVLPVNVLVVTIFRKIRPPDPKAKQASEQDPNSKSDKYKPENQVPVIGFNDHEAANDSDEGVEEESHEGEGEDEKILDKSKKRKKKKKPLVLGPKYAYLAYALIFLASTVSATFTVFYGLTFGKEKSEGWISSIMISFWQDVLISQPLKVFAAAMFFALVIKDPNKGEDENEQNELNPDEELIHKKVQSTEEEKALKKIGFVEKPPDPGKLEAVRQLKLKQKQMKTILYEILYYLFFLVVVLIIAYGNRDPMAYGVTKAMDEFFASSKYSATKNFAETNTPSVYWQWVKENYIPTLKPQYWFGPLEDINKSDIDSVIEMNIDSKLWMIKGRNKSDRWQSTKGNYMKNPRVLYQYPMGFVADHATAYLVGAPRIRQLRIRRNQSTLLPFVRLMIDESNADYEWDLEDMESYHPMWGPFTGNDTRQEESKSPWYYRSAWELKGTPYWGFFASYWGGGYVADLGSDRRKAEKMIANLSESGWIDKYSRALFAEFTIYNPYTNFFSAVTLLTEIRATGGYHHMPKIQTLRLYRYIGPEMVFVMACEITYIAFLVYFLYKQVKKYRAERKMYFKDPWNYLEIAVLSFSISSVGLYFARLGMTTLTIRNMKETPHSFVSFQYVAFLDEWVSATCSLAVFFSFLKFLRLLRFNRRMALLSMTLKQASKPLFYFFIYFGVIFMAYALFGFSIFNMSDNNYSSFHRTIVTLFGMTLGDFDFDALVQANRIFGPLYFFSYVVLIIFILMNVFLSIIVDTFNEVNRDILKQGNDHEMMAFMIHAVKSNIGRKCGPAIKPTYVEEKSTLEKNIDNIEEISENIQYAFRNICMEDIRQVQWFDTKKGNKKKKLILKMLLEDEENFTENDICDAIPILDDFAAQHSIEEIIRMMFSYRAKKREDEFAEDVSRMSSKSSADSDDSDTDFTDDDDDDDDDESNYNDNENRPRRDSNIRSILLLPPGSRSRRNSHMI